MSLRFALHLALLSGVVAASLISFNTAGLHAYLGAIFERRGQAREAFEEYGRPLF